MKPNLFITGAGGFLGKSLLAKLDPSKYGKIFCLTRKAESIRLPQWDSIPGHIEIIEGDLLDVSSYESLLKQSSCVIHMAAATGKADPKVYFKVNAYATMLLLDRCKNAGVEHFLFVSSIAVSFDNKFRYFYALSKEQAENYVISSGLKYTILRPTMIMGKGSPVFDGLAKLACLPVLPVFGDGKAPVQPIDVEDVAKAIRLIVDSNRFNNESLELGGPESLSIEEFMKKIAVARNKKEPAVFHLPLGLIVFFLSILERVVYGLLPLTVGQLASFRNDGSAAANSLMKKSAPLMKSIDDIISAGLESDSPAVDIPVALQKECRVFCKYLVKAPPDSYVLEKYNDCHTKLDFSPVDFHDALLIKLAGSMPLFTRMTDAYSRFFRPTSAVRKKLAYLVAILETSPHHFRYFESVDCKGFFGFLVKAGIKGVGLAFHLLFSFLFLFPLQMVAKVYGKKPGAVES